MPKQPHNEGGCAGLKKQHKASTEQLNGISRLHVFRQLREQHWICSYLIAGFPLFSWTRGPLHPGTAFIWKNYFLLMVCLALNLQKGIKLHLSSSSAIIVSILEKLIQGSMAPARFLTWQSVPTSRTNAVHTLSSSASLFTPLSNLIKEVLQLLQLIQEKSRTA